MRLMEHVRAFQPLDNHFAAHDHNRGGVVKIVAPAAQRAKLGTISKKFMAASALHFKDGLAALPGWHRIMSQKKAKKAAYFHVLVLAALLACVNPAQAASPAVAATNVSSSAGDTTSQVVSLPASIAAGNLLFIGLGCDGNITVDAAATGWTQLKRFAETVTNANTNHVLYRWADGAEGATVTVTIGASESCGHWSARVTDAENPSTTPPAASTGASAGGSTDPNPDLITPPSSKDYLFIATASFDGGTNSCTVAPTNYLTLLTAESTTGTAATQGGVCAAFRQLTTGVAEDPGTFTPAAQDGWAAFTVLIHPASAVTFNQSQGVMIQ